MSKCNEDVILEVAHQKGVILMEYLIDTDCFLYSYKDEKEEFREKQENEFRKQHKEDTLVHRKFRDLFLKEMERIRTGEASDSFVTVLEPEGLNPAWYAVYFTGETNKDNVVSCIFGDAIKIQDYDEEGRNGVASSDPQTEFHFPPVYSTVMSDPVVSAAFDVETGERYPLSGDIIPDEIVLDRLTDLFALLFSRIDPSHLGSLIQEGNAPFYPDIMYKEGVHKKIDFLMRPLESRKKKMQDNTGANEEFIKAADGSDYCLYSAIYNCLRESVQGHRIVYLSIYDIHEDAKQYMDWMRQMSRDPVTGFHTRNAFEMLCRKKQSDQSLTESVNAIILMEINDFEQLWHQRGQVFMENTIRRMSLQFREALPRDAILSRFGDGILMAAVHGFFNYQDFEQHLKILSNSMHLVIDDGYLITASVGAAVCRHQECGYHCAYGEAFQALNLVRKDPERRYLIYSEELKKEGAVSGFEAQGNPASTAANVFIRTFGYFDVFIDGKPIHFRSRRAKELLALLVDRRGGLVSASEAISILWEDEPVNDTTLSRYRKVSYRLKQTLKEFGIEDIVQVSNRKRGLNVSKVRCDYYDYLYQKSDALSSFQGSYLLDYSWGERTTAELLRLQEQRNANIENRL